MGKRLLPVLALLVLMPQVALGQPLRSLVVGADAGIAVPPRGAAPISRAPSPPPAILPAPAAPMVAGTAMAGTGLSAAVPILPVLAAVLLGAAAPGSGGGSAAPATTR